MKLFQRELVPAAIALLASPEGNAQARPSIILATTTSTQDSGLLDVLVPRFEREQEIDVKVIAVGTGAALRMAATGNADAVLVHAPESERRYVESGDLVDGRLIMHNDFVIVGPPGDTAVRKAGAIGDVMRAIAERGAFISRGDESGTHTKELELWARAGINLKSLERREETGQGMGATLSVADQKRAYALTDRATYLALRKRLQLVIVFEGDPILRNLYHAYAVNNVKHPGAKAAQARAFIAFLVSPAIQRAIADFRREEFGQSLFIPDALPQPRR